jgi:transposase-like protein
MRHTKEQKQVIIRDWQNSGLNKKAFCRDRQITYQTFHYWWKRLSPVAPSGFCEVKLPHPHRSETIEMVFPSGARMTFQGEPSAVWLRELLK